MAKTVTDADVEAFDGYVKKWQIKLNLADWRIERGIVRSKKAMAEVSIDAEPRMAIYQVGLNFGASEVTPESLESTAIHEVLHVFLTDMLTCSKDEIETQEHRVIHVLEKILMELPR